MPNSKERPVPYPQVLIQAYCALDALLRGDRLTAFLPELEGVNASMHNVALMPVLIERWAFLEEDNLELFMTDFLNRRGSDHGIPEMRSRDRELLLIHWHHLVIKLVSSGESLTRTERRSLDRLVNLLDAMAHAAPYADAPAILQERIRVANTTVVV